MSLPGFSVKAVAVVFPTSAGTSASPLPLAAEGATVRFAIEATSPLPSDLRVQRMFLRDVDSGELVGRWDIPAPPQSVTIGGEVALEWAGSTLVAIELTVPWSVTHRALEVGVVASTTKGELHWESLSPVDSTLLADLSAAQLWMIQTLQASSVESVEKSQVMTSIALQATTAGDPAEAYAAMKAAAFPVAGAPNGAGDDHAK